MAELTHATFSVKAAEVDKKSILRVHGGHLMRAASGAKNIYLISQHATSLTPSPPHLKLLS